MIYKPCKPLLAAALAVSTSTSAGAADTPNFPRKPVRWIVPYPPGGSIDVVGRVIAARLSP